MSYFGDNKKDYYLWENKVLRLKLSINIDKAPIMKKALENMKEKHSMPLSGLLQDKFQIILGYTSIKEIKQIEAKNRKKELAAQEEMRKIEEKIKKEQQKAERKKASGSKNEDLYFQPHF